MQYPEGALCLEQIKQLLIATHERRVVVYAFNYDDKKHKALIVPVEIFTHSRFDDADNLQGVKWNWKGDFTFLATRPRCSPPVKGRDKERGWVFGNYWLAYAYGLRLQNDKSC